MWGGSVLLRAEGKGGTMVTLFAEVSYTNQRGELVAKERVIAIRY